MSVSKAVGSCAGADGSTGQGDPGSCAGAAASTAGGGMVSCGGCAGPMSRLGTTRRTPATGGPVDSSGSRTTMRPPHFRQRMRAAFASFSSALSSRKRAPQSPHVMSINDNACPSGNGRPVLPSRLRGQRLDQVRETDELDLRHIVAFSEASVHVMGDRVVFPYRFPRYTSSCRTCSVTRTRVGPSFRHTSARADLEILME